MKSKIFIILITLSLLSLIYATDDSEIKLAGTIESLRKGNIITLLVDGELNEESFLIIERDKVIAKIYEIELIGYYGKKIKYLAKYEISDYEYKEYIRAGTSVFLKPEKKTYDLRNDKTVFQEKPLYKPAIISRIDRREMILIPAGKFLMGSNSGDSDEYPEHYVHLGDFYIDKYEVSNSDYKKYLDAKMLKYPESWNNYLDSKGNFTNRYFASLPVIVSYKEAVAYARWCGKQLPTESQWEKAARMPMNIKDQIKWSTYTYGDGFIEGVSNTEEFWKSEKIGVNLKNILKETYGPDIINKGFIPVDVYDERGKSIYGVVHMDGNASEWTDSWYEPYSRDTKKDERFGTQYKVIRGGSYNMSFKESRVTDRKIGGIPDLSLDRAAGFRCVKTANENDKIVQ